jgi:hypothetical protein
MIHDANSKDQMDEGRKKEKDANIRRAMQGRPVASWASVFLDYVELKARLMAAESKEASSHVAGLLNSDRDNARFGGFECAIVRGISFLFSSAPFASGVGLERHHLWCNFHLFQPGIGVRRKLALHFPIPRSAHFFAPQTETGERSALQQPASIPRGSPP